MKANVPINYIVGQFHNFTTLDQTDHEKSAYNCRIHVFAHLTSHVATLYQIYDNVYVELH